MSNVCPKMMAQDYAPGFFLKHFIKDMKIAASQGAGELPCCSRSFRSTRSSRPPGRAIWALRP